MYSKNETIILTFTFTREYLLTLYLFLLYIINISTKQKELKNTNIIINI